MASTISLMKLFLNVNNTVIDSWEIIKEPDESIHVRFHVRPYKKDMFVCPHCHSAVKFYDYISSKEKIWRTLDFNGIIIELAYRVPRIKCPEHGVVTAEVPWAFPGSKFSKDFDMMVAFLSMAMSKKAISELMRIDWETVGRCIERAMTVLEPDPSRRLNGLVNIGIDETSYKKGHKYITVVVNHDTNEVVWLADTHGKNVLKRFFEGLTTEQLATIQNVSADGANWITECVEEFIPQAHRCCDAFHVVQWATDALDSVRKRRLADYNQKIKLMEAGKEKKRGRPHKSDEMAKALKEIKDEKSLIRRAKYSLGKAPEHLTEKQRVNLEIITRRDKQLLRAYALKEDLRSILKMTDCEEAKIELDKWKWRASHSRIEEFKKLYEKVKSKEKYILNTIKYRISNARVESINNKIKLTVRAAYGFRNIENMFAMIYLHCSNIKVPLRNHAGAFEY